MNEVYSLTCPLCGEPSRGETKSNRNGWEVAWSAALVHLAERHEVEGEWAVNLLARAAKVERSDPPES